MITKNGTDPIRISAAESSALRRLSDALSDGNSAALIMSNGGESVELPRSVMEGLSRMVRDLAEGHAVAVLAVDAELTTQQAADLLNISRPSLIKRLDAGDLPFHMTGTHRRVRFDDLVRYRTHQEAQRREALAELANEAQAMGLYF